MRIRQRTLVFVLALDMLPVLVTGCGDGSKCCQATGTGGSAATAGTGGTTATGGTAGTGATATGGATGTGGASATGGSGGAKATGGTGGAKATGGTTGTGGGTAMGGGSGAVASSGCGMTAPALGTANPQMLNVTDSKGTAASRLFYAALPADYAPGHAYPLIFAWHYAGGMASTIAGTGYSGKYYGIQPLLPEAIYIAPQGLTDSSGQTGWPNTNGGDIAFLNAMLSWAESKLCVDTSRIMSTGFSYGGIMSDTLGCQMPDVFRALGVMSGSLFSYGAAGAGCKSHDVAVWITHGTADTTLDISGDQTALTQFLADNHCGTTSTPVSPSPCVSYDGCDSGYPVVWCPVDGEGHTIPTFAASAIAAFFAQF